jgi:hypothetical protein
LEVSESSTSLTGEWHADATDAEGFAVRTVVSNALLLRATDPILLISITDVTELMWTS